MRRPRPEFIPRERFWELLPKRTLVKIVSLLILLVSVIYLRSRTDLLVGFFGPPPAVKGSHPNPVTSSTP